MPNRVSLCIEINDIRGLIWALAFVKAGDSAVFQPLDPFSRAEDSIAQGNVELGNLPVVDDVSFQGSFKLVLVVFDMILQTCGLSLEVMHFDGCLCLILGDCSKEAISDCLEDVRVEFRMGSNGCCNGIG